MKTSTFALSASIVLSLVCVAAQGTTRPGAGLTIVVIEGEDAVNVVQHKSAVAPVVEVRDRNDQPVAGAVVRFAIRSGRASFGGARNLTVTTNAAGRAVATGLTPTGGGALQIGASAAFQGQTAVATIAQTNVMTVAEAAAASGAGASSGAGATTGSATAGGTTGGGLSTTTVAIVGGAAAGGAIAAKEVLGGSAETSTVFRGAFSGPYSEVWFNGSCTVSDSINGTVELTVDVAGGTLNGSALVSGSVVRLSAGSGCFAIQPGEQNPFGFEIDTRGPTSAIAFNWQTSNPLSPSQCGCAGGATYARTVDFTGSLANDLVTGTIRYSDLTTFLGPPSAVVARSSASYPVTLTKQ